MRSWHKSSYSGTSSDCVEVAVLEGEAAVRDTKHRDLGMLTFPSTEWQVSLCGARNDLR
ncbi:DUF397 domain-containing protein [Nocardiopsis algeriensis]|uniref:DUF397 domain-containing protein n=1 Tax=Nocardiopsis algeriensis TaxID=1478215 RepID=UPI0016141B84|nr:DUF397 domain-containing protein [Nocardiopsis algeriensis]